MGKFFYLVNQTIGKNEYKYLNIFISDDLHSEMDILTEFQITAKITVCCHVDGNKSTK